MVIIYCKETTSRIKYTFYLIFSEILGISYEITNDIRIFNKSSKIKINYSRHELKKSFHIEPEGLLEKPELVHYDVKFTRWGTLPIYFHRENGDLPFDIFSAVFYLVSRYEEYLPFKPDLYGRFEANQSIAAKGGFLNIPIVDLWCIEFSKMLGIFNHCKNVQAENYSFQLTIDVDRAWVFKHKGLSYSAGSLIKDVIFLKINKLIQRLLVSVNKKPDPGDAYSYLSETQKKLKTKIRYFILCGKKARHDNSISIKNKNFQNLIKKLDAESILGLHPSYASNESFHILEKEYNSLENTVNRKIVLSRQHFLKLNFPDTYRNLLKLGIREDYSLGFSTQTGFRAGIARSFYFYDLFEEKQTSLKIVPFQVMDRTLLAYKKLTPNEANNEFAYYTKTIKSVGGQFVSLWHNTSLSDFEEWKGWRKVFDNMVIMNSKND